MTTAPHWIPVGQAVPPVRSVPPSGRREGWTTTLAQVLLVLVFVYLGLALVFSVVGGIWIAVAPDSPQAQEYGRLTEASSPWDLFVGSAINFAIFAGVPLLYLLATRVPPLSGTGRWLGVRSPSRMGAGVALGAAMAVGLFAIIVALEAVLAGFGRSIETGESPALDALSANLTWWLVILIPLFAGVGEELFFRGFLQPRVGVYGQAALFSLAHVGSGAWLQAVTTLLVGILFGVLRQRGQPIQMLIAAHVTYDVIILGLAFSYAQAGATTPAFLTPFV